MSTPGAAMEICAPRFACGSSASFTSVAVTARTSGSVGGPGVPAPRYQHHALLIGLLECELHQGIARPGEAHIDDARAFGDRPVDAFENLLGGAVGAVAVGAEGVDREDARARRHASEAAVRGDGAGHAGTVRLRLELLPDRLPALR